MNPQDEYEYRYSEKINFYCYPGSDVLVNKFNIRNSADLATTERQITALKITQLEVAPVKGLFDLRHLQRIHKFIFGDIYAWAGVIRGGDFLIKNDSIFCRAMFIENVAKEIHTKLKAEKYLRGLKKEVFIQRLAYYMGEINALHPFREGNGRTQRIYFKQLCKKAGFELEFNKTDAKTLLQADIAAFNCEYDLLVDVLTNIIHPIAQPSSPVIPASPS